MSSRSRKRAAKRAELRAAWEKKVEEVVRKREAARRPERVHGHEFVDRMEELPTIDAEHGYGKHRPRRVLYLKNVLGDDRTYLPRRFVIPYEERVPSYGFRIEEPTNFEPRRMLEFTWRSFGVDAGDTRVRWYAPVLVGPGSLPQDAREWGAARKCAAYAERLLYDVAASQRFYPYGLEQVKHGVAVLREALAEFLADDDPVETRAEREVSTGAR